MDEDWSNARLTLHPASNDFGAVCRSKTSVACPMFSTSTKKAHDEPGAHFGFVSGM